MPILNNNWKTDNYKFVGKAFDFQYANLLNELLAVCGKANSKFIDYEITGTGGFGELQPYDGSNLNNVVERRGFKTIIRPEEFTGSAQIGMFQAEADRSGECAKTGKKLGYSAAMTVYNHMLRVLGGAFDATKTGGDGKAFAATDHPVASKSSTGRTYVADPEAGTYSNLTTYTLTVANMGKVETMARKMVTPDGLPLACNLDTLLVSPDLEPEAKKIFGENSRADLMPKKDPSGDTNAANPVYGKKYIVIGGGADGFAPKQWAYCDSTLMKEVFKLVYGHEPSVFETAIDNPLIQLFTAYVRFGIGWGDARQIIFSNPA